MRGARARARPGGERLLALAMGAPMPPAGPPAGPLQDPEPTPRPWFVGFGALALVLFAHAWLSQVASRLRPSMGLDTSMRQAQDPSPHNFSQPPSVLLPPRSVEELLTLLEGGMAPCATGDTAAVRVAWPEGVEAAGAPGGARRLALGARHVFSVQALTAAGQRVTCGGDYLEAQLEGLHVRARPPTRDRLDGTYEVEVSLPNDPLLAGPVTLNLTLLFVHFAGMEEAEEARWHALAPFATVFSAELELVASAAAPLRLPSCRDVDFMAEPFWTGHWVRVPRGGGACPQGLCQGDTARLPHPWVYRLPSCAFELFSEEEARQCVDGAWIFVMGDSCNPYSINNLFRYVLGTTNPRIPKHFESRTFDYPLTQWEQRASEPPEPPPWLVRLGHVWMGGWDVKDNGAGLSMMLDRDRLMTELSRFLGWPGAGVLPDLYVVNSGLHDGVTNFRGDLENSERRAGPHPGTTAMYSAAVTAALEFFTQLASLPADIAAGARLDARSSRNASAAAAAADDDTGDDDGTALPSPPPLPRFLWRQTVAIGGNQRSTYYAHSNPQKMEVYAHIMTARLLEASRKGPVKWRFLDEFDMTFPFRA